MNELIGKTCQCTFVGEYRSWPIQGSPARVSVLDVDMPMVKIEDYWGRTKMWVNCSQIATLVEEGQ